ncbi:MAG: hypothetical protein QG622_2592 [Actinomycetota bacterium]|nr:hypothetical protein [Actinomycetota bacterium]
MATRRQLLAAGVTKARIRSRLGTGEWQRVFHGVYVLSSGAIAPRALVWAAILFSGAGAAAGPRTSLWLAGAFDDPPSRFDVVVPEGRRIRGSERFALHRRARLSDALHPAASPPRLRVEPATIDLCRELKEADEVIGLLSGVVQRGLTTVSRLRGELEERRQLPHRALIVTVLADIEYGVRSVLEHEWLNNVERAHGLPPSTLNRPDDRCGRREYRDAEFKEYSLVVELDGARWHGGDQAVRDRRRDNRVTVSGRLTLRYGWEDITHDPCGVAAEVAAVLRSQGWTGTVRRCGPTCSVSNDHPEQSD